jgi:hypothetical protein
VAHPHSPLGEFDKERKKNGREHNHVVFPPVLIGTMYRCSRPVMRRVILVACVLRPRRRASLVKSVGPRRQDQPFLFMRTEMKKSLLGNTPFSLPPLPPLPAPPRNALLDLARALQEPPYNRLTDYRPKTEWVSGYWRTATA